MNRVLTKLVGKPFSTKKALDLGISKSSLTRMVTRGILERVNRGIYQMADAIESEYTDLEKSYIAASLRCGTPSAVCLLSALEYYHVTDEIPARVWMMVPESKRVVSKDLKPVRCRDPKWKMGIHKTKDYWITTMERTLIDCVIYKKLIGHQVALDALKKAVREKKVKLGNLYDLAKKMGVAHRLKPYIEVLGS